MKDKFAKMSKIQANLILMIIAISVLMIPAATISYADSMKVTRVLSVHTTYINGTTPDLTNPINQTIAISDYNAQTVFDTTLGNYFLFSIRNLGSISTRRTIDFKTGVSYIGNNQYSVVPDFSNFVPDSSYPYTRFRTVLDISAIDFSNYDFVRISNSENVSMAFEIATSPGSIASVGTSHLVAPGEYIVVNTLSSRAMLNSNPNATIYLWIGDVGTFKSTYNKTLTFSIEMFNLSPADALTWNDDQIYVLTLLGCNMLMITAFVFTTNFVDIKLDRTKPQKPRKRKSKR